ncbi:MAG: hypothetical protein VX100_10680 [Pseudomonadota bacterium]|nr:hypothetical protein [Pseudomonadota bacterium]
MRYIDVNWFNESSDEPYRLVSEIGLDQYETRKLEFFPSGEVGYASPETHTKQTMLGIAEVPELEEINSQEEFQGQNISKQEFEQLWLQYTQKSS